MSTQASYLFMKSMAQRLHGLCKKGHEFHEKFDARVTIHVEVKNVEVKEKRAGYLSHTEMLKELAQCMQFDTFKTPNDFVTVAQERRRKSPPGQRSSSKSDSSLTFSLPVVPPESQGADALRTVKSSPKPMARHYFHFPELDPAV